MKIIFVRILLSLAILIPVPGLSAERIALVIGNGAYMDIGRLPNPPSDARLISSTLESVGFTTTSLIDADQYQMKQSIAEFGRQLRNASKDAIGLFYYAGHGIQAKSENYLLPIEARPNDEADLDLMGVEANWVLRQMESAGNRTNIIVLDACRNNPFVAANRSMGRGLAQIEAPTGSFISYATAPGQVALDGTGKNSPFTTALANALSIPGLAVERVFKKVRIDVLKATDGQQIPWDSSSLVEDIYIVPESGGESEDLTVAQDAEATKDEVEFWNLVTENSDSSKLSMFLQLYPESQYADTARQLLKDSLVEDSLAPSSSAQVNPDVAVEELEDSDADLPIDDSSLPLAADQAPTKLELPSEAELLGKAQSTRTLEDYQNYLDVYPQGIYAEFVKVEIDYLKQQKKNSNNAQVAVEVQSEQSKGEQTIVATVSRDTLGFDTRWITVADGQQKSINELSSGSPEYSPIEGLPDEMWKEQSCSNCHSWESANLCEQGKFYIGSDDASLSRHKHPYGGAFKSALKQWATTGCQ